MKGNCLPAAWFPLFFLNQVCSPDSLLFALYSSFACRTDSSKTAARIAGLCARASFYDSAMLRHACLHWGERLLSRQKLLDRMRKYPLRLSTLNWAEWFRPCFFFFPARRNRSEDMGFSSRVSSAIRLDYISISMNANPYPLLLVPRDDECDAYTPQRPNILPLPYHMGPIRNSLAENSVQRDMYKRAQTERRKGGRRRYS